MIASSTQSSTAAGLSGQLQTQGYHVFEDRAALEEMARLADTLRTFTWRRTPLNADDRSQYWSEGAIPAGHAVEDLILPRDIRAAIEDAFQPISRVCFWANHYAPGEFIPKHCDTEGDLQMLLCVIAPPQGQGGTFMLHSDKTHELSLKAGERMLFPASRIPHQTTPITSDTGERVVCVARMFF